MSEDRKTPLEHAVDLCVFAPLGFALEARSLLPKFVDRGRNQVVLARVVGKYAVRKGNAAAEARFEQVREQAAGVLRLVGVPVPGDDEVSGNGHAPKPAPGDTAATGEPEPAESEEVQAEPEHDPLPVAPSTLGIPDYDTLSASQVVPRLEGLTADELQAVREYESSTRARKTILNKIAQLQAR